jgi:protein-S-isoprenylcysteine O-methyltransferase Ste14
VRHPSYTGLLLVALGFGLAAGNWLSLATCAVIPLLGLLPRIAVEESEPARVLGDEYRSYQRATHRIVPGTVVGGRSETPTGKVDPNCARSGAG